MLGNCACPILLLCVCCGLHVNKAGRELFSIQRGTDGLPIVVRPVTEELKSFLSNWVELGWVITTLNLMLSVGFYQCLTATKMYFH